MAMDPGSSGSALASAVPTRVRGWTILVALLVVEIESVLFWERELVFKAVRSLLGFYFPLDHIPLAFLGFAVLIRVLVPNLPPLAIHPISSRFLAAHLACVGGLLVCLEPLCRITARMPAGEWIWVPIGGAFFGTWLACLIPPPLWRQTLRTHAPWALPAMLLALVAPVASRAGDKLWTPLVSATFHSSGQLLYLLFDEVVIRPEEFVYGTPDYSVRVTPGCSGSEGVGLIALFTLTYLWLKRDEMRFPSAFWLLPINVVASWLANCVRLAALVAVGTWFSPAVAGHGFHTHAGWLSFTIVAVACLFVVEKNGFFRRHTVASPGDAGPTAYFLLPLMTMLFTWMLSQAFSHEFDVYYPIRTLVVALVLYGCRHAYLTYLREPSLKACALGVAVYLLWLLLVDRSSPGSSPMTQLSGPLATMWLLFRVAGAVVVVPLVEELAFRGYLLRRLQSPDFDQVPVGALTPLALVGSALAFGLLHQDWLAGVVAGLAYGYATRLPGGLTDAVVAHGTTNLCLALHVLAFQEWSLW